jgi:hypothetical protein
MKLYKRCDCAPDARCDHHYWYRFSLHRREHRGTTHTANRELANRIAIKRQAQTLETHEKLRKLKSVKLSEHVDAYANWAEKTNRSSLLKDRGVLKGFLATVGDRALDEITAFHVERWKTQRAKDVSQSSVNRELNVIRGCFSRAVEWGRLMISPMKAVKPYRVDNVRMRVLSPDEIQKLLESCPPALALIARTTLESLPRLSEGAQSAPRRPRAGLRDHRADEERQDPEGAAHAGAARRARQACAQERVHLRPRQGRQAAAPGSDQRRFRPIDARH